MSSSSVRRTNMQYFQTTGKSWIMYERLWFSSLSFVVLHLSHICLAYSVNTTTESKLYRHLQRFSTSLYWGFPSSQRHSNSSSLLKERSEVTARLWRLPLRISQATCTAAPVTLWERTTIIESLSAPACCSTQHLQYGICCYLHNVKWYKHFRHVTFSSNLQAVVHQGLFYFRNINFYKSLLSSSIMKGLAGFVSSTESSNFCLKFSTTNVLYK